MTSPRPSPSARRWMCVLILSAHFKLSAASTCGGHLPNATTTAIYHSRQAGGVPTSEQSGGLVSEKADVLLNMWVWSESDRYISGTARKYHHTWDAARTRVIAGLLGVNVGEKQIQRFSDDIPQRDFLDERLRPNDSPPAELERLRAELLAEVQAAKLCSFRGGYVNVGGNIGSLALPVAAWLQRKWGSRGCGKKPPLVVAYEASRSNAAMLQRSIKTNGLENLQMSNLAVVASAHKPLCLPEPCAYNMGTLSVTDARRSSAAADSGQEGCPEGSYATRAATLDELAAADKGVKHAAVMTIDCEGCEGDAIRGAAQWLHGAISGTPGPCVVCMEITLHRGSYHDIFDIMAGHGFVAVKDNISPQSPRKSQREQCFLRKRLRECMQRFHTKI